MDEGIYWIGFARGGYEVVSYEEMEDRYHYRRRTIEIPVSGGWKTFMTEALFSPNARKYVYLKFEPKTSVIAGSDLGLCLSYENHTRAAKSVAKVPWDFRNVLLNGVGVENPFFRNTFRGRVSVCAVRLDMSPENFDEIFRIKELPPNFEERFLRT